MKVLYLASPDELFTASLAESLVLLGAEVEVWRGWKPEEAARERPDAFLLGPFAGPLDLFHPVVEVAALLPKDIPLLAVGLGMVAWARGLGAQVAPAPGAPQGMAKDVRHDGRGIFRGLPSPFSAGRYDLYHVLREGLPGELIISAQGEDGALLGLRRRDSLQEGILFHPESYLTSKGPDLLAQFLNLDRVRKERGA